MKRAPSKLNLSCSALLGRAAILLNPDSPSPLALEISRLGRTIHSLLTPLRRLEPKLESGGR
jgi:hypothetical protein